jgi:hypothetical protein
MGDSYRLQVFFLILLFLFYLVVDLGDFPTIGDSPKSTSLWTFKLIQCDINKDNQIQRRLS